MSSILYILIIALCISIYINYNLLRKYEDAEDKFNISEENREKIDLWLATLNDKIIDIDKRIHEIDKRGSFEADDEIGFFFTEIKKLNNELKAFV